MNRNSDFSFSQVPSVEIERSRFDRSHSFKFSGNVGDVIPVYCDPDILPGDTVVMDSSKVIRFQTMLTPIMDNIHADFYWFFVPHRLVWDHWQEFQGENTSSAWIPAVEYTTPKLVVHNSDYTDASSRPSLNKVGTILDYLGYPVEMTLPDGSVKINALPVRAYATICEQWFRSENLTDPINIYKGDADQDAVSYGTYIEDVARGGAPFKACKDFDLFTASLPSPQKGPSVTMPLGSLAPVGTRLDANVFGESSPVGHYPLALAYRNSESTLYEFGTGVDVKAVNNNTYRFTPREDYAAVTGNGLEPMNLYADLGSATAASISDLRMAFQMQRYYERLARSGSRYVEIIKGFFNVDSPDSRLQRAEYLGGNRVPIVVDQVTNTAQTSSDALGDVGAFSRTSDYHSDFTHSFVEHGTLMCVAVLRYDHTYSQGIPKYFLRDTKFDYYIPTFAHISEQPIEKAQLFAGATGTFGYNEAWAEYRYAPNRLAGEMRPYISGSLGSWHLGDDYSSAPSLSDEWIREDKANVDRVLSVTSEVANQFWCDMYFSTQYTRPLPLYSVPGLIDHF